jgi:hypothetical protein
MSKKPEKPKTRKAPAARTAAPKSGGGAAPSGILDPAFGAIAAHKALQKEWHRLYMKLDEAECNALKTDPDRPGSFIEWRDYSVVGGYDLDRARDNFLCVPGANHEQVEKEYQDAKARLAAAERARDEWDLRVGIAPLREQFGRIDWEEHRAARRLARTKPESVAGAAAVLAYLTQRNRVYGGFEGWEFRALETVAAALTRMEAT